MSSLESTFDELLGRLSKRDALNPANSDPFYYFPHPTAEALEVKTKLPAWIGRLRNAGWTPEVVSLASLMWEIIERSGRWETWLEAEQDHDVAEINAAVSSVLGGPGGLVDAILKHLGPRPEGAGRPIVLFTDALLLHPWYRVRAIEGLVHDKVAVPGVVFYPGRRAGTYGLHFLDFYGVDNNYRSTLLGTAP